MARDLDLLEPEFKADVERLLKKCKKDGFEMKPFYTLRSVHEQAKLYRQSRPFKEIQMAHDDLIDRGAPFLASVLMGVGPCSGKWATNALPGFSWHQHGEAVDCYWLVDGKAEWSTKKLHEGKNGYIVYANHAQDLGLEAGHNWMYQDSVHVQKSKNSINSMLRNGMLTVEVLDRKMKDMFDI